jgi:hypothetical protein
MTGVEARRLALAGTVAIPPDDMPYVGQRAAVPRVPSQAAAGAMGSSDQPDVPGHPTRLALVPPPGLTIAEARLKGITGTASQEAIRKQLRRDANAPAPVGKHGSALTYDEDALYEYAVSMRWVTL